MAVLKLAVLGAILGAITSLFGYVAGAIIFGAALGGAIGWWYRKLVRPMVETIQRAHASYELAEKLKDLPDLIPVLSALPAWMRRVDTRFDQLERKADEIHEPAEAVARELGIEHRRPAA